MQLTSLWIGVKIVTRIWVSLWAMGFLNAGSYPSVDIYFMCHRFGVVRVSAAPNSAFVIQLFAFRDGAVFLDVGISMR
jgi:hypothetical protein